MLNHLHVHLCMVCFRFILGVTCVPVLEEPEILKIDLDGERGNGEVMSVQMET